MDTWTHFLVGDTKFDRSSEARSYVLKLRGPGSFWDPGRPLGEEREQCTGTETGGRIAVLPSNAGGVQERGAAEAAAFV